MSDPSSQPLHQNAAIQWGTIISAAYIFLKVVLGCFGITLP